MKIKPLENFTLYGSCDKTLICVHLLMYWACSSHAYQTGITLRSPGLQSTLYCYQPICKIHQQNYLKFDSTNLFAKNLLSVTDRCVTLIQACSYHHSNLVVMDLSSTVSSVTMFMFRGQILSVYTRHACMLNNIIYIVIPYYYVQSV